MKKAPEGKFLATVKIGAKGQIVIPKEVRDMFSLQVGDSLVFMADKGHGIALQPFSYVNDFLEALNGIRKD